MNSKSTWILTAIAALLFAFIYFFGHPARRDTRHSRQVLPGFNAAAVTRLRVRPAGQLEILAERTNKTWQLTAPLAYPAQTAAIERLLTGLQQLTYATYISEQEAKTHPGQRDPFGVGQPEFSVTIGSSLQIHIGHRTEPGDQVFVEVVGVPGIYVVDADLLKLFPRSANDWRDTQFANLSGLTFDRLLATNGGNVLELQRDATRGEWRMIQPLKTRADAQKIADALRRLESLEIRRFVTDDPNADLESFGLQPPSLSIDLARGTNVEMEFDFGNTNGAGEVYARRGGRNAVVLVDNNALAPWRATHELFRDRRLVPATEPPPQAIQISATDRFLLQRQTNGTWRLASVDFPADAVLASEAASNLLQLQVSDFVKDSVTDPDLPTYGLAAPARRYFLFFPGATNELDFGTNREGRIFARRAGESFVYAIAPADFARLPAASWQLRQRKVWSFSENDVTGLTVEQNGRTRKLLHTGTNDWSFAPGSQGIINPFAIEETVHQLGALSAAAWIGHGQKPAALGFGPADLRVTAELKDGSLRVIEFGRELQPGILAAAVVLDQQPWILQCPTSLSQLVQLYLALPQH